MPAAVYRELTENTKYIKEAEEIKAADFLKTITVKNVKSVNVLRSVTGLDEGESEALIMYDEQKADVLLMDERKGRSVAKQLKVRYIGTVGILMLAYDKELIQAEEVKKCLDTMILNEIRLDEKVYNIVMEHVGLGILYLWSVLNVLAGKIGQFMGQFYKGYLSKPSSRGSKTTQGQRTLTPSFQGSNPCSPV